MVVAHVEIGLVAGLQADEMVPEDSLALFCYPQTEVAAVIEWDPCRA